MYYHILENKPENVPRSPLNLDSRGVYNKNTLVGKTKGLAIS
jgi:hypothetical protein